MAGRQLRRSQKRDGARPMRIERRNTTAGQSPYAGIDFRLTTSEIRNPDGSIVFRAEMDLAVAVTACPASTCNGGAPPRPVAFEILAC